MKLVCYVLYAVILFATAGIPNAFASSKCRAIDGDTLICGKQRVRLANVYAAEKSEPGGLEAKARLATMLRMGNVEVQPVARDKYGRTVANVFVNGQQITQSDIGSRAGIGADRAPFVRGGRFSNVKTYKPRAARAPKHRSASGTPSLEKYRSNATRAKSPRIKGSTVRKSRQSTSVRPHIRKNGSFVSGHRRR